MVSTMTRGDDGKFVDAPRAEVDDDQRAALMSASVDAADDGWGTWEGRINAEYEKALRAQGVTGTELTEASTKLSESEFGEYRRGRENGISHAELMGASRRGVMLGPYVAARRGGASVDEVMSQAASPHFKDYSASRYHGASHDEAVEAMRRGWGDTYASCRCSKIPHAELLEAAGAGIDLDDYREVRRSTRWDCSATHAEVMEAHDRGVNLDTYAWIRGLCDDDNCQVTHATIMERTF
jgi:hypothetical protein